MMNNEYDVIIVGGGPAGMTAALYLTRENYKVAILEKKFMLGGEIVNTMHLQNFPTIEDISGTDFAERLENQIEDKVDVFYNVKIESVDPKENIIEIVSSEGNFYCKDLIIANGRTPRKLGLPNEDKLIGHGIYFCATCDGPFFKDKIVTLIGDGPVAVQYALQLANYAESVNMYTLTDRLFCEEVVANAVRNNEKINIIPWVKAANFIEYDDKLAAIDFEDASRNTFTVITDNLFLAVGQEPHNEFISDFVDLESGYIKTDEFMQTKTKHIYAVGDTRAKECKQAVTACADGTTAAMNIIKNRNSNAFSYYKKK